MSRVYDNLDQSLGPRVREALADATRLDVAVGYFNLRGWGLFSDLIDARAAEVDEQPVSRVLIGMVLGSDQQETLNELQDALTSLDKTGIDNSIATPRARAVIGQLREQLMRGLPSSNDRRTLQRLRQQVATGQVRVKVFTAAPLHGKTYIVHRDDHVNPCYAYVGSSNLTTAGLLRNLELNVEVVDQGDAEKLAAWFEDRWNDDFSIDLSDELLALLDESWASPIMRSPYEVYIKLCYDLSRDVRDGQAEYTLPAALNYRLLDYQREAVQTLARRVHRRGGTMLGDVVGLGKTLTAIAVAALMREEYGYSTLVICPKNLRTMWQKQLDTYQLHSRVVPYSMAGKELPELRRFQLVIIDESHTLRNPERKDYQAIYDYIRENSSKVLLLTATPYNVGFDDVASQLGLWIDDDVDLGVQPTEALGKDPSLVDKLDGHVSTLNAFRRSSEPEDWKRLMSEHLVRRTRSFIERAAVTAGHVDSEGPYLLFPDGHRFHFPKRDPRPVTHSFGDDDPASIMADDHTLETIRKLRLPRYKLDTYVDASAPRTEDEQALLDRWQRGRGHVAGFVRTSLYKRLSSCGHSFVLSLRRHISRNELVLYALDNDKSVPVGSVYDAMFTNSDADAETDRNFDPLGLSPQDQYVRLTHAQPTGLTWVNPGLFTSVLADDLVVDTESLTVLLDSFGDWTPEVDSKLDALIGLVAVKHPGDKILIFTEYQDTAYYLEKALKSAEVDHVGLATGATDDPTSIATRFSPKSTARTDDPDAEPVEVKPEDAIRVLIATDVLSEGQNLQDAHIVVNYDLPWAIIRLIQRAGRVDRIGQDSPEVIIYSFVHDSVDRVINLRERISQRLGDNAAAFGSDEQFFGSERERKILHDLYDGHIEPLDRLEGTDDDVDAASLAYQEWTTAISNQPHLEHDIPKLPDLLHATKAAPAGFEDGVACFVRTTSGLDAYAFAHSPDDMRLVTGHEILALFHATPETVALPDMQGYDDLLSGLVQGKNAPLAQAQIHEGRMRGTRRRVWQRLRGTLDELDPDSSEAIDALERFPLTTDAERRLRKALRDQGADLASIVTALYNDAQLIISRSGEDPIRIVSSMGIRQ